MTKTRLAALAGIACTCLVGASLAQGVSAAPGAAAAPVVVGMNMNYSGPSGFEGQAVFKGATLAFKEQNAKGGVNGHKIQWTLADNQCDPSVGINAIRELIFQKHVDVLMGSNCSSVTLGQMPIIKQAKIPMVSVEDSNTKITQEAGVGGNPYLFHLNLIDQAMITAFARQVIAKEVKSVAILAVETDYGLGVVGALKQNLPGVKILSVDTYQLGQSDYRSILTKIKSEGAQALVFVGDYPEGSTVINQLHELGITNLKIYTRGDTVDPSLFKLLGNKSWANGIKEANFWAPGRPASRYLEAKYLKAYHEPLTRPSAMGYFGASVIIQALKAIHGTVTSTAIQQALAKVNFNLPGLGRVHFDQHNQNWYPLYINTIVDGKIKLLKVVPVKPIPGL